jgi:hypothetical protein
MYKLTNDPIPASRPRVKYPFSGMDVQACAVFPADANFNLINKAAHQVGANHKKKFTVRRCVDGQIRVWRIA